MTDAASRLIALETFNRLGIARLTWTFLNAAVSTFVLMLASIFPVGKFSAVPARRYRLLV